MVWIIALLCLALAALAGYYRGPICAGFSFLGILFGLLLSAPLAPLAERLLPIVGFHHPVWQLFVPKVIVFFVVLIIFNIVGGVLHRKLTFFYKYQKDERLYFRWERLYTRLGASVGLLNGSFYFFLLMMPVYVGGYFTTEAVAAGAEESGGARLLTHLRADLHGSHLDRVLAPHDPIPPEIYRVADLVLLVLRNPILESRLAHYPPLVTLSQRPEIQNLGADVQLQEMIQSQVKISVLLAQPKIQALVTNAGIADDIRALVGHDLNDLQDYLNTGKSAKYDGEKILGVWTIDIRATWSEELKRNPSMTPKARTATRAALLPLITGLSIAAATDNQIYLKKQNPNSAEFKVVGQGTWSKTGDSYSISLPNNKPDTTDTTITTGDIPTLLLPRDGHVLVFNKEM